MMRKPQGYGVIADPGSDRPRAEFDSTTCHHCQKITLVGAGQRAEDLGGFCCVCSKLICSNCVGKGCDPFEEKLKRHYARQDARRSYGI